MSERIVCPQSIVDQEWELLRMNGYELSNFVVWVLLIVLVSQFTWQLLLNRLVIVVSSFGHYCFYCCSSSNCLFVCFQILRSIPSLQRKFLYVVFASGVLFLLYLLTSNTAHFQQQQDNNPVRNVQPNNANQQPLLDKSDLAIQPPQQQQQQQQMQQKVSVNDKHVKGKDVAPVI